MLKIYNSVTQKKEEFKPIHAGKIGIYVCGPTVYDFAHIGNGRTYAAFDVVIRYLRWRGYEVHYVRNITDIDDKIIKRAQENNEDFSKVVERYTNAIHEDFAALGLLSPNHEPKATEYVPNIIKFIEDLISKKFAYVASNGDVYYDVRKFETYGKLSHRDIDQLESGARVEINTVKNDPLDFVLWKLAKPGEPHWSSPWGEGRPGWHIECSAMSSDLLGAHFDIHGGGKDLIFPHHENEIAQSEAVSGHCFVNTWMHTGYLQIEKEKMSKSLGNFFTIRDVLQKYPAEVVRYFMISGHYRSPVQYSENAFQLAQSALGRLYNTLRGVSIGEALKNTEFENRFIEAMDDDFNTPVALSVLFDLSHEVQKNRESNPRYASELAALLKELASVLGILQNDPEAFLQLGAEDLDANHVESLIAARNKARAEKNWQEADKIRDELAQLSVVLEDSNGVTTWRYEK